MSDFTILIAAGESGDVRPQLAKIAAVFADTYGTAAGDVIGDADGSALITEENGYKIAHFADKRGWLVVKGMVWDIGGVNLSPPSLFAGLLADRDRWAGQLNGNFALALWDAVRRELFLLNDHGAKLNLYFGTVADGHLATTAIMPSAVALGIAPSPASVREYLARGTLLAPRSLFADIDRVDVGQSVRLRAGEWSCNQYWLPFRDTSNYRSMDEAATDYASTLVRAVRQSAREGRLVIDLTGGYDTRLVVAAALFAGVDFGVTTNGEDDDIDMIVARRIARAAGLEHHTFRQRSWYGTAMDWRLIRELACRTAGELNFAFIHRYLMSRPELRRQFRTHLRCSGGELLRYFPWSHELTAIGRRRPANIDRLLRFRFLQDGRIPKDLYRQDWWPGFINELAQRARAVCAAGDGTTNTQQLDAVYIWKMTSHDTAYATSCYGWMPSVHPLLMGGVMDVALAVPWRLKLTARLTRMATNLLSPRIAALPTQYGGTAAPPRMGTLHLEAKQFANQAAHFVSKMDRVLAGGRLARRSTTNAWTSYLSPGAGRLTRRSTTMPDRKPWLTDEFHALLSPPDMFSRALYDADALADYVTRESVWRDRELHFLRMVHLELLFRELRFTPDASFLND